MLSDHSTVDHTWKSDLKSNQHPVKQQIRTEKANKKTSNEIKQQTVARPQLTEILNKISHRVILHSPPQRFIASLKKPSA